MSEMKDVRLLPCPFCGDEASIERRGTTRQSNIVTCDHCGARVESGDTFDPTLSWNRRTALEPAPKPAGGEWVTDDLVERVAIERHHRYDDEDTVKWGKQPSRYRTSARKTAREVLTSLAAVCPAALPTPADSAQRIRSALTSPEAAKASEVVRELAPGPKAFTLDDTHVRLLRRGTEYKWIGLSDNAGIHVDEVVALGELERAGLVKPTDDDLPPGPPAMCPREITDAGRTALAKIGGDHDK